MLPISDVSTCASFAFGCPQGLWKAETVNAWTASQPFCLLFAVYPFVCMPQAHHMV